MNQNTLLLSLCNLNRIHVVYPWIIHDIGMVCFAVILFEHQKPNGGVMKHATASGNVCHLDHGYQAKPCLCIGSSVNTAISHIKVSLTQLFLRTGKRVTASLFVQTFQYL